MTGFFMFSRFIYIVACVSIFISKEYSIVWVIPHVFINSSGARCSGCLHLLVFVNNAAMNICVQVFVFKKIFFKILFIYFKQRGREGEREGEKHQCVVASCVSSTGDLTWPTTQACALARN